MKTRAIKSIVSLLLILMVTVASLATATAVGSKYYYYDLMFYTAGSSGISQDYIYMQIHGEKGSTDWEKLSCCGFYRRYGSVSLGDFNDVGKVTGVSVKNECIDGWYPEKIEVISPSKEKTTIYCAGWVDNNDEVRFDINKNILEVNVKTSSALFSGTDADVWAIFYDENGKARADLLAKADEEIDMSKEFRFVDPQMPWKNQYFENCTAKNLQQKIFENGKLVYDVPSIHDVRDYVRHQLENEIWEEEQRFHNPHKHYMDMTPDYYEMKMSLLHEKNKA